MPAAGTTEVEELGIAAVSSRAADLDLDRAAGSFIDRTTEQLEVTISIVEDCKHQLWDFLVGIDSTGTVASN